MQLGADSPTPAALKRGSYIYGCHTACQEVENVEPKGVETYLLTLKDRGLAKAEDFIDNSIVAELDREGFIDEMYRKYSKKKP